MSDTDERAKSAVIAPVLGEDERGELERLRQEVAALRATRCATASSPHSLGAGGGCCPVGTGVRGYPARWSRWTHNQVAVRPLRGDDESGDPDPAVQSALANRIGSDVLGYIDVEARKPRGDPRSAGLRPQLVDGHDLTGPLADRVAGLVHDRVGELVATRVHSAWNRAIQVAHQQANDVLPGQAAAIAIEGDMAVLGGSSTRPSSGSSSRLCGGWEDPEVNRRSTCSCQHAGSRPDRPPGARRGGHLLPWITLLLRARVFPPGTVDVPAWGRRRGGDARVGCGADGRSRGRRRGSARVRRAAAHRHDAATGRRDARQRRIGRQWYRPRRRTGPGLGD